jgi:hypothetical protein
VNDYYGALESLVKAIGTADGTGPAMVTEVDHLTRDQQLQVAQILALLSISQELSAINGGATND